MLSGPAASPALQEVIAEVDVKQRYAQHRTVGGDQRQEDAQQAVECRAGLAHHHLGELNDDGDHQNEGERAQIHQIQRNQNKGVDHPGADGGQRHNEGGGHSHADGAFQLLGNAEERAQAKKLHQNEVVHQYGADKQEQVFGHCDA